ncbi:hypothetical protein [Paenibacillus sp. NAIST15-1]|uniref:BC1872 family protein n=1 Tax=Paenibacillus sp. NAIST15-1 TaxID=1605994 RepID=UPI000869AC2D|nr:hypothetical protein [Paenibacillus sp. NAIST15-1]GAV11495.1 hypothetical protein PBN151_1424 [Paenibacillus sp. NAIST15-1]
MLIENILSIKTGRELDAIAAEKVMSWKSGVDFDIVDDMEFGVARYEPFSMDVRTFSPSTDISSAWELVNKLKETDWMLYKLNHEESNDMRTINYRCVLLNVVNGKSIEVTKEEAPEAICKATVLAML